MKLKEQEVRQKINSLALFDVPVSGDLKNFLCIRVIMMFSCQMIYEVFVSEIKDHIQGTPVHLCLISRRWT